MRKVCSIVVAVVEGQLRWASELTMAAPLLHFAQSQLTKEFGGEEEQKEEEELGRIR